MKMSAHETIVWLSAIQAAGNEFKKGSEAHDFFEDWWFYTVFH